MFIYTCKKSVLQMGETWQPILARHHPSLSVICHCLSFTIFCHYPLYVIYYSPLSVITYCLLLPSICHNPLLEYSHCLQFLIVFYSPLFVIPHYLTFLIIWHSDLKQCVYIYKNGSLYRRHCICLGYNNGSFHLSRTYSGTV